MALIQCKECGKTISDKAAACPHCGAPVSKENPVTCYECGQVLTSSNLDACPSCGAPLKKNVTTHKRKLLGIRVPIMILILVASIIFVYSFVSCFTYKTVIKTENSSYDDYSGEVMYDAYVLTHDNILRLFDHGGSSYRKHSREAAITNAIDDAEEFYLEELVPFLVIPAIAILVFTLLLVFLNKGRRKCPC